MNNKNEKINITKKNPPFYYAEGKGWFFDTKAKAGENYVHVKGGWFSTKSDAATALERKKAEAIEKANSKAAAKASDQRWDDFVEDFIELRRSEVRGSSLCSCDLPLIRKFFAPMMSGMKCSQAFSAKTAIAFRKSVAQASLSRKRKNRAVSMYKAMVEFAFETLRIDDLGEYRGCKANMRPFKAISEEEGENIAKEKPALDKGQLTALVEHCRGTMDWLLVEALADLALRIGELCALRPMDFDFDNCMVSVRRQWTRDENSQYKLTSILKSKRSYRTIPVGKALIEDIKAYVYEQGISPDGLIFKGELEEHIDISALNRRLKRYCREAGVPEITSHGFRHAKATQLSNVCLCDADRQAASYFLGHSVSVDQEVYAAHVTEEQTKKLIAKA